MLPRIVIYDACVLHPPSLRDLLIRIADAGLVRARWTEQILDGVFVSVLRRRPDLSQGALLRTRRMMCDAVPNCLVTDYEGLADTVALPDADDRHVLAAALKAEATTIVTFNLRDFPETALAPLLVEAVHPDDLLVDLMAIAPVPLLRVLHEQAAALRSPPRTVSDVLDTLERSGLTRATALARRIVPML